MKIRYRPEIDGLRAISVIAVILYHADLTFKGIPIFAGGFIGVDIFLVISGYLITSLILKEINLKKDFSFINFYERRARRILPALFGVIIFSLPFAWMYLLPIEFKSFSKSIIYTIFFGSNFYFHFTGLEYGAPSSFLKPFLHTWSLAIEEQFYIIFPIIIFLTFKFFKKNLIKILIALFIISLIFAEWGSKSYPSSTFYFLHSRAWEVLAGSLLAYYGNKKRKIFYNAYEKFLPAVGIVLIIFSFLFYKDDMFHPSIMTVIPVTGVALIIWFAGKKDYISKILSTKFFVSIGLISYSLYLYHYPLFSFARISGLVSGDVFKKIILALFIIFFSISSYFLIERPFRKKGLISKKKLVGSILVFLIIICSFNFLAIKQEGFKSRVPEILQKEIRKTNTIFNTSGKNGTVVLIGDSHAGTLEYNLNKNLKQRGYKLERFFTDFYINGFNLVNRKTNENKKEFPIINRNIKTYLAQNKELILVFHHRSTVKLLETYFDNKEGGIENRYQKNRDWEEYIEPINKKTTSKSQRKKFIEKAFVKDIEEIHSMGHKIIIIYPVPEVGFDVPRKIYNEIVVKKQKEIELFSTSYDVFKERNEETFKLFDSIKLKNIYRIYPHTHLCNKIIKNRCVVNSQKDILYWDDDHLSLKGSELVVNDILEKLKIIDKN